MYNILLCYGTRPEWIKIKPVINAMKRDARFEPTVLFTGQHETMHGGTFDRKITGKTINTDNRLNDIIASHLTDDTIGWKDYDAVLVQGDTASVFSMALQAYHHKVPIIHLEAGMRTWDLNDPYPEEGYRQMISRITNLHLCPTETEQNNLFLEEIDASLISVVGNTVLDNIKHLFPTRGDTVFITMHRRENEERFEGYFKGIVELAEEFPLYNFVFPMHLSPSVQKHRHIFDGTNVKIEDPIDHNEFIIRLSNCNMVITDSGGVQEESVFLDKPTIVCRQQMERALCEGTMSFQAPDPKTMKEIFRFVHSEPTPAHWSCPYGDGNSAEKVLGAIEHYMENIND